jgi:PQQ-dependent catabolism-associated beta-propeller protein
MNENRTARRAPLLPMLPLLVAATMAHAEGTVWVSSEKDHAIAIVDATTLTLAATLPTCKRPRHMQLLPGGKQLLVACGESNAADLIDVATRRSVRRLPIGDDPEAFDLSPDGKTLYVTHEDEGTLGVVDLASGRQTAAVPVGKEPEGVKASADGKTVYVTSEVANLVHVVDVASAKVLHNIKVGKRPRRMALTPDGAELWVTNELDASVSIVSTKTNTVVHTLRFALPGARAQDITPVGIAMTRDGRRAFVGLGRANHVAFVDVARRETTHTVLAGKRAWNVALDKAEARLYVVNGLSDDLTVIDVAGAKALKSVPVGRVPYQALVVE